MKMGTYVYDTYDYVGPYGLCLEEKPRRSHPRSPIEGDYSLATLPLNGRPHYQNKTNLYIYYAKYKKGKKCWIISKFFNEVNIEKRPLTLFLGWTHFVPQI